MGNKAWKLNNFTKVKKLGNGGVMWTQVNQLQSLSCNHYNQDLVGPDPEEEVAFFTLPPSPQSPPHSEKLGPGKLWVFVSNL